MARVEGVVAREVAVAAAPVDVMPALEVELELEVAHGWWPGISVYRGVVSLKYYSKSKGLATAYDRLPPFFFFFKISHTPREGGMMEAFFGGGAWTCLVLKF